MVVQNLTYAWTKLFTAFCVILGLHLYLRGWRKASRQRMVLAFVSLPAGMLVHYSAGPYALFVGLHYLLVVFRRRKHKWAEAAVTAGVCLAVLGTWFAWSMAVYGTRGTVASTSTVTDVAPTAGGNVATFAKNLGNTLFPSVLRRSATRADPDLEQADRLGKLRDVAFLAYQQSLPFAPRLGRRGGGGLPALATASARLGGPAEWRAAVLAGVHPVHHPRRGGSAHRLRPFRARPHLPARHGAAGADPGGRRVAARADGAPLGAGGGAGARFRTGHIPPRQPRAP